MRRYQTQPVGATGWTGWIRPVRRGYKAACCDCGLIHEIQFRINSRHIEFRVRRANRSTGQYRRWHKETG